MASIPPTPQIDAAAHPTSAAILETDLLVVGAGPAGASLACFLAQHGEQDRALERAIANAGDQD
jgi:ribulose 1,5-bisphosphate synthetase/thiazole synthase